MSTGDYDFVIRITGLDLHDEETMESIYDAGLGDNAVFTMHKGNLHATGWGSLNGSRDPVSQVRMAIQDFINKLKAIAPSVEYVSTEEVSLIRTDLFELD